MSLVKNNNDIWEFDEVPSDFNNNTYKEALIKYINIFDNLFTEAYEECEFEFLLTMLRVRGIQDAGWDPYETSIETIQSISKMSNNINEFFTQRNLRLWLYGHIVEATEPYEVIANLLYIVNGGRYSNERFPPHKSGRPKSPGARKNKIKQISNNINMEDIIIPLDDIWDRNLRNAIFHSDYIIHGNEVRITSPLKKYENKEINDLINKALAYFESLQFLYHLYIKQYNEPKIINVHPDFSNDNQEKAVVIVRKGKGAVGLKDNWSKKEIKVGKIPFRIGRFYPDEIELLDKDHTRAILPRRNNK